MIDFSKDNSHIWKLLQSFPAYWTILGQGYRAYDYGTIDQNSPAIYKVEFPTDKNVFLFFRELNTRKQRATYRVLIGGDDDGNGTNIPIYNKNTYFQALNPSGATITKGVTLSGVQQEIDYEPVFGAETSGSRSSGGVNLDGNVRVYEANSPVAYIEVATPVSGVDQEYKLELQWVEA